MDVDKKPGEPQGKPRKWSLKRAVSHELRLYGDSRSANPGDLIFVRMVEAVKGIRILHT